MPASFEFTWRDDGILMVKRSGFMTLGHPRRQAGAGVTAVVNAPAAGSTYATGSRITTGMRRSVSLRYSS
jgi:hypothetical protein